MRNVLTYGKSTARLYGAFVNAVPFAGMAPTGIIGKNAGEYGTGDEGNCYDADGYHKSQRQSNGPEIIERFADATLDR